MSEHTVEVPYALLAWCYANLRIDALASDTCIELRAALGEGMGDPRPTDSASTCNCRRLGYPHGRSARSGCPKWGPWSEPDNGRGSDDA